MKSRTFKVGKKYREKSTGKVYYCEIDYHSWDRMKRLVKKATKNRCEFAYHVSHFKRSEFTEVR